MRGRAHPKLEQAMNILILGGTSFLGPHVVEAARKRAHTITLFNRGKTNPQLFPELEKLRGDRNGNLKSLEGRKWDACVDTSGYVPRQVSDSATLLAKNGLKHYVFVSTASVYPDDVFKKPGVDENTPVARLADESVEKVTAETYGPLKALCEVAAEKALPGRVTNIRPGLIVGPLDTSDRFTYWPARALRGGEILAPAPPDAPVQYMDARDLARWLVKVIEDGHAGAVVEDRLGCDGRAYRPEQDRLRRNRHHAENQQQAKTIERNKTNAPNTRRVLHGTAINISPRRSQRNFRVATLFTAAAPAHCSDRPRRR